MKIFLKSQHQFSLPALLLVIIIASLLSFLSKEVFRTNSIVVKTTNQVATSSAEEIIKETPKGEKTEPQMPIQYGRSAHVSILTYHYIGNNPNLADKGRDNLSVSPDLFEAQMAHLAGRGYTPISLDTMYAGLFGQIQLPGKPIILTFDDGYIDFYVNAFPILRRFNFHAVVFIPTGLMGGSYYLTWDQIKEMDGSSLISFQSHSVNHPNLNSLDHSQLTYQLSESKKTLEVSLGKPVNFIAYPFGASNSIVWQATREAGYLGGVGTWYGTLISEGTMFNMPRVKIGGGLPIDKFALMFP